MPNPTRPPAQRFEPGDKVLELLWAIAGVSVAIMLIYGLTLSWW